MVIDVDGYKITYREIQKLKNNPEAKKTQRTIAVDFRSKSLFKWKEREGKKELRMPILEGIEAKPFNQTLGDIICKAYCTSTENCRIVTFDTLERRDRIGKRCTCYDSGSEFCGANGETFYLTLNEFLRFADKAR